MNPHRLLPLLLLAAVACVLFAGRDDSLATAAPAERPRFRAGACAVDIAPPTFPVRVNGMFTERTADKVVDPLAAKALALDDGTTRLVLCVVDTCMMDRALIDDAKARAEKLTGLPTDRMLVSATHTHSAPAAMGCLGSRVDPGYATFLPGKIAEAIAGAVKALQPAQIGWAQIDDWDHTFNRRWIRRSDRVTNDPFGQPTVRAMMHPGHLSADAVGPSGPVDPGLSVLAVRTPEGRPISVLANYSMHYVTSDMLSSDYFGRFAVHLAEKLGAGPEFVGIMSQGTSGDLWLGDYGAPPKPYHYDSFAREMVERAAQALSRIEWKDAAPLAMAERTLPLSYRVPDAARLEWARKVVAETGDRLPTTQPEIYAAEAVLLHEKQRTELKLQALRIGDLGIAAMPNEVVALSGLKVKRRSPFPATFTIELANGAEGYIPPPEQHALGGYITWPARTAGLEVEAEPKIVEACVDLLATVAGRPAKPLVDEHGAYPQAVLASKPVAYWRLDDMDALAAKDASPAGKSAAFEPGVAVYLPGAGSGTGDSPNPALAPSAFSGTQINRSVHFAGGRMKSALTLPDTFSVECWLCNGLPTDAHAITGYLFSRGVAGDATARGEHLGLGGTAPDTLPGRLFLYNGNDRKQVLNGRTPLATKAWHHVVFVRKGNFVRVHLDGAAEPEISGELEPSLPVGQGTLFFAGRSDGLFGLEGRLDEVAVYDRALTPEEIAAHHSASALAPAVTAVPPGPAVAPPLSPRESMAKIHVRDGFGVELMAAEPLTMDPVAIDWDAAGRLWVVEMADYPLGLDGKGKRGGRVRVLEDTDGDGRPDKSTLFADGLNFPTGLLTWRDGIIVTAAPDILYLRDTDGDGRADVRDVLVSGLLEGNQQLRANGLRWGLDNWVYCAAGGHHGTYGVGNKLRVTKTGAKVEIGSRDFRFRPDTGELEPESGPSQFGRNRDDWGHWFGTQNSRPLWHYVLPDRYLRRNPHVAAPDPTHQVVVPLNPKVWPVSPQEKRFHSFEQGGHFTSACSGMIYRDTLLFPAGPEMHAFTCEPFHNVVQHNIVTPDGVTFAAHRDPAEPTADFFASEDRWCRPVMARTGPDGALWVVDMYRYMIEHPDWLPENGKAELLPHYRLGEDRGRLYRVFPSGALLRKTPRLDQLGTDALVPALDSPNEWQRDKAHQLLLWRGGRDAVEALTRLASQNTKPLARVHALSVLDGLDALAPATVAVALSDPAPGVRENALRLAERRGTPEVIAAAAALADDPEPKVRLQLAFTLGEWESPVASGALAKLALASEGDAFLRAAVLSSAVPHVSALVNAVGSAKGDFIEPLADLACAIGKEAALDSLVSRLAPARDAASMETLARLRSTLRRQGDQRLEPAMAASVQAARDILRDAAATPELQAAAARLILDETATLDVVSGWLTTPSEPARQLAGISLLAETGADSVPARIMGAWPHFAPSARDAAFDALLTREAWTLALLSHEPSLVQTLDPTRRARLTGHVSAKVRELAASRLAPALARAEVIERFKPALQLSGDAARGAAVHARLCAGCHRMGDVGLDIGPNLRSVASHPPEKLLTNILAPNVDVQPGFYAYQCRLKNGTDLFGLLASETANSLGFKLADGTVRTVLRSDVASLQSSSLSLMPEGLEAGLSVQDMADLIFFLKNGETGKTASVGKSDLRVGAAAVNLRADDSMPLAGYLEARYTKEQEGELRATAVVIEKPGEPAIALVDCDVLWVTRAIVDPALEEISRTTGLAADHVLVNATHTHHAPGTAPAHAFGWSPEFAAEVQRGIVKAVQAAHARLAPASFRFGVGTEQSVGANSRLRLPGGLVSWLNPLGEAGLRVEPTGPFDPQLPVFDFRDAQDRPLALFFGHSTHTIGTRSGRDVRSPSFYGLAAQELERELGGVVGFLEGASGSTHNIRGVTTALAIHRMKEAVAATREAAEPVEVASVRAIRRPFAVKVRHFDEAAEDAAVERYVSVHAKENAARIREIFATQRRELAASQGSERTTWLQVLRVGDVAIVGVPAEYFTGLGLDIKRRSPFKHTVIAELANDWIGYLPDADGHRLGGYQTWTGHHSWAEPGTGERMADEAVRMLGELMR